MRHLLLALSLLLISLQPSWANDTIKIGLAVSLDGFNEIYARQQRAGMNVAVQILNENGGIFGDRVEIVEVDDRCDAQHAAVAAFQLLEAGVVAVVGHTCSNAAELAASIYEQHNLPLLTLTSWPSLTENDRRHITRLCGRLDQQAQFAASYLTTRYEENNVAGVFSDNIYGQLVQASTGVLIRSNSILSDLRIRDDSSPVEGLLREFASEGIHGVMVYGAEPNVAAGLTNGAQRLNLDIEFVFDGIAVHPRFRDLAANSTNGVKYNLSCYVPVVDLTLENQIGASLVQQIRDELELQEQSTTYQQRGGELGYALHSFAAVQVLTAATTFGGSLESEVLSESIRTGWFKTVVGDISFDDRGDVKFTTGREGYVQQYFYRWFMVMDDEDVPWTDSDPCPEEENAFVARLW